MPATWIWYPGDFEMFLNQRVHLRRMEGNHAVPPMWRLDLPYVNVQFRCKYELAKPESVRLRADGSFRVYLDNQNQPQWREAFTLPAGSHELLIGVANGLTFPAIYLQGETVFTGPSWETAGYDADWRKAASWNFPDPDQPPGQFSLPTKEQPPVFLKKEEGQVWVDFGQETFGRLCLQGVQGPGQIKIYYGESEEEARSDQDAILQDQVQAGAGPADLTLPLRAFRYVRVKTPGPVQVPGVTHHYEYLPLENRGAFRCSNHKLNKIWDTALYTLQLNSREFFLDGIKRDGWVWSGDAYQSFLMNYYCFFDAAIVRRTLTVLRGRDPVKLHLNTILDYTFYWFLSLYDYYLYTGDRAFLQEQYPAMLSLMDFCLGRRNQAGLMEGRPGDWVFIDWADFEKRGEVSAEQILFWRSLEALARIAVALEDPERAGRFGRLAAEVKAKVLDIFWDPEQSAFITSRWQGKLVRTVVRHPNIYALLYGLVDADRQAQIASRVLHNAAVPAITTPFFRFFELASLCGLGEQGQGLAEILAYWGGMLDLGATTFWEEYKPQLQGAQHYAMYDGPFEKSLCHAWGASPLYLLGRYFLGVRPLTPGYATFRVEPNLGGLDWLSGTVPLPHGQVQVKMDKNSVWVKSTAGQGELVLRPQTEPRSDVPLQRRPDGSYLLSLEPGREYLVHQA